MDAETSESRPLPRFTCITCRVAFRDAEIQRAHYKTDWHRYNLKRKVAELPPVSVESFKEKVLAQREADGAARQNKHEVCEACKKHFTSRNSYESHLRSRKHREAVSARLKKAAKQSMDTMADAGNIEESVLAVSVEKGDAESGERNIEEESAQALPVSEDEQKGDAKSMRNLEEESARALSVGKEELKGDAESEKKLEEESAQAVSVEPKDEAESEPEALETSECLFCPRQSRDMERNLNHMTKTHGFFVPELAYLVDIEGLITYLCEKVGIGNMCLYCNEKGKTFHSVESAQQHMVDKCHCKLFFEGDAAMEYAEYYDYSKSYPDFKETEKTGEEPSADADPLDVNPSLPVPETCFDINDSLELLLPSGVRVGHRALKLYYRQRLPTQEQRKAALVSRLVSQYKALGWKEAGKMELGGVLRQRREVWGRRMQKSRDMRLSVKANKLQPYLRPQVVF